GRVVVHLLWRADLADEALVQHNDAVAHGHGFDLVVRHVNRGCADALVELLEVLARRGAELGIEVRERLVQQEDGRLAHNGPGERHALALASGKLPRFAVQQAADPKQRGGPLHLFAVQLFFDLLRLQREGNVVIDREVRVERIALEDHGDAALARREVIDDRAANEDLAGRGLLQAGDHAQPGGLAGTRWPQEDEELAFPGHQINLVDRPQLALLEDFRQTPGFDNRHRRSG